MLLANITQRNYWTKNYEIMDMVSHLSIFLILPHYSIIERVKVQKGHSTVLRNNEEDKPSLDEMIVTRTEPR